MPRRNVVQTYRATELLAFLATFKNTRNGYIRRKQPRQRPDNSLCMLDVDVSGVLRCSISD